MILLKNKTFHASRPCTGTARCPRHKRDPGDIIPFLYLMTLYRFCILFDFCTIGIIQIIQIIKSTFGPGDIISSLRIIIAASIIILIVINHKVITIQFSHLIMSIICLSTPVQEYIGCHQGHSHILCT